MQNILQNRMNLFYKLREFYFTEY